MKNVIETLFKITEAKKQAMIELKRVYTNATEEEKQTILDFVEKINDLNIDKIDNICIELQSAMKYKD